MPSKLWAAVLSRKAGWMMWVLVMTVLIYSIKTRDWLAVVIAALLSSLLPLLLIHDPQD